MSSGRTGTAGLREKRGQTTLSPIIDSPPTDTRLQWTERSVPFFLSNPRRALALLFFMLLSAAAFGAQIRLYLKDGTFQPVREYEVKQDRVRYFSTEREEWEEIPLELVDLARTKREVAEREATIKADAKATAEEDAALETAAKEVEMVPTANGVYYIHGDKLDPVKQAESKIVGNKGRKVLQILSPLPTINGRQTVELDGESSALRVDEKRPEFFIRLTEDERFGIIKLGPKKGFRVVETIETIQISKEATEKHEDIATFRKQEADGLFKIWPEQDLEPGEYALIEYTENKINLQVWDFGIGPAPSPGDSPKKRK
jgi:hypothetical protein